MMPYELISQLEDTPRWLAVAAERLSGSEDDQREEEWSFSELLSHIEASDHILASRVMQVLVRPGVALPSFDERRWADVARRLGTSVTDRLDGFIARRKELVSLLQDLKSEEWDLSGIHDESGAVSIHQIVEKLASHESEHRGQAEALGTNK